MQGLRWMGHCTGCPLAQCSQQQPVHRRPLLPAAQRCQPRHRAGVAVKAKVSDEKEAKREERSSSAGQEDGKQGFDLDAVNPWSAGRRTRHV